MKKMLYIISATFALLLGLYIHTSYPSLQPIHKDGILSPAAQDIFYHLGESINTLEQANSFAQKNLLRTGERWDAQQETDVIQKVRASEVAIKNDLKKLEMLDAVKPSKTKYIYALVMGALLETVQQRMDYLAQLIKQGYQFEIVVLLGGQRALRDIERQSLPQDVTTEAQMMVYVYENNEILKNQKKLLVDAPMITKPDGTQTRPTTDSTLEYFTVVALKDGFCLVISNNPFIARQTAVTQRVLDQTRFPTDGAGPAYIEGSRDILVLVDEFARTVYELFKQFGAKK
jgi:hypothetical protein